MQRTLVIFVKAPRLGQAKTRLAADIGALSALQVYRSLSARLVRRLGADARWTTRVAIAPDEARGVLGRGGDAWPASIVRKGQGHGDLGRRMERALAAPPPGPVVLIGSDCPAVTPGHIARAFEALGASDAVLGPAEDGGYWLVGLQRRPFLHGLFEGVRMSSEHALEDTLANLLRRRRSVTLIDRLADIDTGADLARWQDA